MAERQILTVREAVQRAKSDGLPVAECALRRWIKTGEIPTRAAGNKRLIFYPNLVQYLQCGNAQQITAPEG